MNQLKLVLVFVCVLFFLTGCSGPKKPVKPEEPEQISFSPEEAFTKYTSALAKGDPEEAYKFIAKGQQMVYPIKRWKEDYQKQEAWFKKTFSKIRMVPGTTRYMKQKRLASLQIEWPDGVKSVWVFQQEREGWKLSEELLAIEKRNPQ